MVNCFEVVPTNYSEQVLIGPRTERKAKSVPVI